MKRMFIYFISILMVLLVQKDVLCNDEIPIKVDENIQSQIERIATETLSEGDLFQAVSNLDKDGKNIGRVLPQLILGKWGQVSSWIVLKSLLSCIAPSWFFYRKTK